jgi:hypothetical protein
MNHTEIIRRTPSRAWNETKEEYYKRLDKFCAEWTVLVIEDFKWKLIPKKPMEIVQHEAIPREVRVTLEPDYYRGHPVLGAYYEMVRIARNENQAKFDWLLQCRKEVNEEGVAKIDKKLKEVTVDMLWPKAIYR